MVVPPTAAEAGDLVAKYLVENGAGDLHAQAAMSGLSWALRTFERPYWAGLVESCVALPELKNCSALLETAFGELQYWLDLQVHL